MTDTLEARGVVVGGTGGIWRVRLESGATIAGIRAARQSPKNSMFTRPTSTSDKPIVIQTSLIAREVNTV